MTQYLLGTVRSGRSTPGGRVDGTAKAVPFHKTIYEITSENWELTTENF